MADRRSFFRELKRRNVLRAAVLYLGAVWAASQGISQLSPALGLPDLTTRWFLLAAAIGLPFWLAFAWFYEFTPRGFRRDAEVAADAPIRHSNARKLDFAIIGVLALAVVLLLANTFVWHKGSGFEADTAAIPAQSIAVLPLVNDSGEKDQQYFSDGLSDDLITALSQFAGLKVIARDSSFKFRNSGDDPKTIGAKLGVAHLLEGSVQRSGGIVRVSATLINAADGTAVWSQHYDRPYQDLFALQDDITQQVAGALKARLLDNGKVASQGDRPPSGNLAAYSAYQQGRYHFFRHTGEDAHKAIDFYSQAISLDPAYARAYAELAITQMQSFVIFSATAAEKAGLIAKARVAVKTALALQPDLGVAHYAHGFLLQVIDFDLVGAVREFRSAAELEPQNSASALSLGIDYASFGSLDEAAVYGRRATALDPLSSTNYIYLARTLIAAGRFDEAEAALQKSIEANPQAAQTYSELAVLEIQRGNPAAAVDMAKRETDPFWRVYALALADFANGDRTGADAALGELTGKYADSGPFQIAQVYALRKQPDQMFTWLEHGLAVRDPGVTTLLYAPFLGAYRDDPRFAAFCRKVGLPTTTDAKTLP
ncbi:MAG: tetratricopeptide repeat protein [Proteobacteria bacterium]|nr:tetratricopeptide repeat protein [Pseudomonadota bacterium]